MHIVYSESARKRIGKLGATSINGFLEEITPSQRNRVLAALPRLRGFRKGSPLDLKERTKLFVNAISHAADHRFREHDLEWKAFAIGWLCWAKKHFSVDLEKFQGTSQRELAEYVIREADEFNCAREDLEKLLQFSFLADDVDVVDFVAARPGREELKSRRQVEELLKRVEGLAQRLDDIAGRIENIEKSQHTLSFQHDWKKTVQDIEKKLEKLFKHLEEVEELGKSQKSELTTTEKSLRLEVESIGKAQRSYSDRTKIFANEVDFFKSEIQELQASVHTSLQRFEQLSKKIDALSQSMPATAPKSECESRIVTPWDEVIRWVPSISSGQVRTLDGIASIFQSLTDNYCAVGIEKDDSDAVASIVTAGIVAGQLLTFGGSLADLLVDATCAAVFGEGHIDCEIPVGLSDSGFVVNCESRSKKVAQNSALVLRAANRSAFEVYAGAIRSLVLHRQVGRPDSLEYRALIATICSGPSVLDSNESMLELGPTIDSDQLRWSVPKWKKIRAGTLKGQQLQQLYKPYDDIQEIHDIVKSIIKEEQRPSALRKAILLRALSTLALLLNIDDSVRLELLLAAWVIPTQKSRGASEDALRKMIHQCTKSSEIKLNLLTTTLM